MTVNKAISATSEQITKQSDSKLLNLLSFLPFEIFNKNKNLISVLRLDGVIGKGGMGKSGINFDSLNDQIEKAFKPKSLLAVCLIINSPGGLPVQAELIAHRIRSLADEKGVAVYSFVEDIAASGGYWLACAADEIYVSKSSIIGSIGVISSGFGMHKAIEKLGIERRIYAQGSNKSVMDPFSPAKDEDVKIIKGVQQKIYNHFVEYVKTRRNAKLTQSDEFLFNGEFWAGQSAVDFGLVDGIDNLYNFIKNKFGSEAKVKQIKVKESFIKKYISAKTDIIGEIKQQLIYDKFNL